MNALPEQLQAFWQHVAALEAEHGVELTDQGRLALIAHIGDHGFNPDVTREGFASIAAEADTEDAAEPDWSDEESNMDDAPYSGSLDPAAENFMTDAATEFGRLQQTLGRNLSPREAEAVGARMAEDAHRFDRIDAKAALEAHYSDQGRSVPDLTDRAARQGRMQERMEDAERAEREEREANEPERVFDPMKHEDRVELIMHRMDGGEVEEYAGDE